MMARSGSWEQVDAVIYERVPELRTGVVKGTRQGVYGCCSSRGFCCLSQAVLISSFFLHLANSSGKPSGEDL